MKIIFLSLDYLKGIKNIITYNIYYLCQFHSKSLELLYALENNSFGKNHSNVLHSIVNQIHFYTTFLCTYTSSQEKKHTIDLYFILDTRQ